MNKVWFSRLSRYGLLDFLPDREFLKIAYHAKTGRRLNLDNPRGFNEKLQWLKLYNRDSRYPMMVDKYAVKLYVSQIIGEQYVIPTLGVWDSFDRIDFDTLPNQFVLKCTHDSGGLVICKDKSRLDKVMAEKRISDSLKRNYYWTGREWPYKSVRPQIIAEKYMTDSGSDRDTGDLKDYKFYCFNGTMRLMMINSDRNADCPTKADYFDRDYNWLDFTWGYQHAEERPNKPKNFETMVAIAEKLAHGLPHVRVDLYECGEKIYFGELTFYDGSGFDIIEPIEWDYKIGEMLELPPKDVGDK